MSEPFLGKQLPSEIIVLVISHIPRDDLHMRTLWSCCLLSRDWYHAAIGPLYAHPSLGNKNFDKFAKTICAPVNSHARQIGLESLVVELDMGELAYESTNSLTARLLRRTRINLRLFVAPAVSFSISCLAPLSKCSRLKTLDLSRDFYDLPLESLLNAIRNLPIEHLSLPRSAMRRHTRLYPSTPGGSKWPILLRHLVINDWLPQNLLHWQDVVDSWPDSLRSVGFEDCFNWNPFWEVHNGRLRAVTVKHVHISLRRGAGLFPIKNLVSIFPNVKTLAIPTPRTMTESPLDPNEQLTIEVLSRLETLTLRQVPSLVRVTPWLPTETLLAWVEENPQLYKIEVPEGYLQVENDSAVAVMEQIEVLMSSRVENSEESGVYLT